ncbi:hypothetical protein BS50DRAFT_577760 [Corynespora cassiicola Philippines]|uniref:Uncharacterized protein n=1 Tax=Corynespora cassiicola Philippines TaxID=1448308 RepID=A0A2T2NCA7_CORCC|nr:hypothetical protein BS50DRAFT_577760 [Corynespora cassiicola Philippines]
MPLLNLRELVNFEPSPDNSSETVINGVRFNLTALNEYNYTLYSNNTISNNSRCYLIFDNFKPFMRDNGSWVNATTCYIPYYRIGGRGAASVALGTVFGLSIMFTLVNLRKHGRQFLREDKRFRIVGRRWQWYWMLFVAGCAMVSTLTGVDVDRYYIQQLPIILQSFFYTLMVPGALAMVWEGVRHWGSWQERLIVDEDPYVLPQDDKRSKVEFWLPLIFYLFAWLEFFMTIPRSWTGIQKQATPEQKEDIARPSAINARAKAGAILGICAWFVITYSLYHSVKCYKRRGPGVFNMIKSFCRHAPPKHLMNITLLAVRLGYGVASAWFWDLSIQQDGVNIGWPFGLGYGPILAIILIYEIYGFIEPNEDKVIIQNRIARGRMHDEELNITRKPNWWNKNFGNRFASDDERLRNMIDETARPAKSPGMGGDAESGRPARLNETIEMGNMNIRNRSRSRPPEDPFRDQSDTSRQSSVAPTNPTRPHVSRINSDAASTMTDDSRATGLTGMTLTGENATAVPQQRYRSMLDI